MKYFLIASTIFMSACVTTVSDSRLQEKKLEDRASHDLYIQSLYDEEYVADCYYYEEMECEFE